MDAVPSTTDAIFAETIRQRQNVIGRSADVADMARLQPQDGRFVVRTLTKVVTSDVRSSMGFTRSVPMNLLAKLKNCHVKMTLNTKNIIIFSIERHFKMVVERQSQRVYDQLTLLIREKNLN